MALEQEGCRIVFSTDINKKKLEIYAENFDSSDFNCSDIRGLTGSDIPEIDIATASFPCTDLSLAGNRAGLAGSASSVLLEFLRVLKEMREYRPSVVMLENVTGFVTSSGGRDLYRAVHELNKLGYHCDLLLLDAKWFVPQSRQRVFIVGSVETRSEETISPPDFAHPAFVRNFIRNHPDLDWQYFPLPTPTVRQATLDMVVERLDQLDQSWWDEKRLKDFVASLSPIQAKRLDQLRCSPHIRFSTAYRRTRRGNATWEIRSDDISGCLRTNGGGSSKQALVEAGLGDVRVRWMTAREYARLQGVPFFKFRSATESQAKFAFGDGVCVPAVTWLARHCLVPQANRLANYISTNQIQNTTSVMTA
ncbi:MAG: DNA (cytosine-5-)-methyltransferase [Chloroflexi bacterium]|nr:DNA (cytosine-5-)-methyltransferase [Chloroflexota bacterium]